MGGNRIIQARAEQRHARIFNHTPHHIPHQTVSFGNYYFEIAMTLRKSMFFNAILTNLEIWYNLKQSEIDDLEDLDRLLLRKVFGTLSSCPK